MLPGLHFLYKRNYCRCKLYSGQSPSLMQVHMHLSQKHSLHSLGENGRGTVKSKEAKRPSVLKGPASISPPHNYAQCMCWLLLSFLPGAQPIEAWGGGSCPALLPPLSFPITSELEASQRKCLAVKYEKRKESIYSPNG